MGFYIQDDYWEAAQNLSQNQQDKFIGSLCRYYFDSKEPQDLKGQVKAMFALVKERVRIARVRSESGKQNGKQTAKQNAEQTAKQNPKQNGKQNGEQNAHQNGSSPIKSESEIDISIEPLRSSIDISKEKEDKEREKPLTAPCPVCGAESEHVDGSLYRCPSCDDFGAVWELAC